MLIDEKITLKIASLTKLELTDLEVKEYTKDLTCLLYTSPSPRDRTRSRMPSSA